MCRRARKISAELFTTTEAVSSCVHIMWGGGKEEMGEDRESALNFVSNDATACGKIVENWKGIFIKKIQH